MPTTAYQNPFDSPGLLGNGFMDGPSVLNQAPMDDQDTPLLAPSNDQAQSF